MKFLFRLIILFLGLIILGVTSCSTGSNTGSSSSNANVVEFLTPLTLSKDGIFVGEETQIQATLSLKRDTSILITEVILIRVDGDQETELEVMTDDGNPDTGDLIANDSVYNLLFSLDETAASFISVKAKIEFEYQSTNTTNYSETKTIAVMNRLSDDEWDVILNTPNFAQTYYETLSGTSEQNASDVASYVLTLSGIANSGTSEEGHGVWWVYETGVLGGIIFREEGGSTHKGGPEGGDGEEGIGDRVKGLVGKGLLKTAFSGDENAIQSKKALYLGPYLWDFGDSDDYHGAWEKITGATCPSFVADEYSNSSEGDQFVTLDHFKNLSDYGIVVISTHGDNWYNGLFTWWDDYFGGATIDDPAEFNWLADELSVVILSSGFLLTDENKEDYESDIQQHRLVVASDQELLITPNFIDEYNDDFPNSIIYLSSCRSTYNDSLTQVFLDHGAGSVLGYSDYVSASYARDVGGETFSDVEGLLDSDSTSIALAHASAILIHGENDGGTPPASYELEGSSDTNLDMAPILDGFFEEARISSWISFGEYMAQGYVGDIESPEGDFMGVMTTYLGNTENIEVGGSTFLSQSFCVPDGATTLNFQYNVISEEAECGVDDRFVEDTFKVFVFDDDGNYLGGNPLVSESSSTSEWFALEGDYFYAGDDASTPGECHPEDNSRDDGTFETGWKSVSLDLSDYAGLEEPLTLYFEVNDGGDLIYDTVVGIDEVFVE